MLIIDQINPAAEAVSRVAGSGGNVGAWQRPGAWDSRNESLRDDDEDKLGVLLSSCMSAGGMARSEGIPTTPGVQRGVLFAKFADDKIRRWVRNQLSS